MTTLDEVRARRCPVCASDDPEVLFDNRMSPIAGIDFSYRVVACGRCSMVYAAEAPVGSTLASYYRDSSKYDFGPVGLVHAGDQHRANVAASFTRRWVRPDARILDVGCSIGVYLASLKDGGFTVKGVDPSESAARVAKSRFGIDVDVGVAADYDRYGQFDAIALLAVLEHLRDPCELLATISERMKPGALLIIEVPDADNFGDYPSIGQLSEPFGEFSNEHINFFGTASLRHLAEEAGLSFVASERLPYLVGIEGLMAVFRKGRGAAHLETDGKTNRSVRRYVDSSSKAVRSVEARLADSGVFERPCVLYGAGSHSARLLAQGPLGNAPIAAVLDRNPHLTGTMIGGHRIATPDALSRWRDRPVVVSSFHAMRGIVEYLQKNFDNEIVTLYPMHSETTLVS